MFFGIEGIDGNSLPVFVFPDSARTRLGFMGRPVGDFHIMKQFHVLPGA